MLLVAGHGPLDEPLAGDLAGDADAVSLAVPAGAVAVARVNGELPLTPVDLRRLRVLLRRRQSRFRGFRASVDADTPTRVTAGVVPREAAR